MSKTSRIENLKRLQTILSLRFSVESKNGSQIRCFTIKKGGAYYFEN